MGVLRGEPSLTSTARDSVRFSYARPYAACLTSLSRCLGRWGRSMADYPYEAKRRVEALIKSLETLVKRDPMMHVQGMAVPVLGASLESIKQAKPDDPVVQSLVELMS